MFAPRLAARSLSSIPRASLPSRRWATGAPGQVVPVEKSSPTSRESAIRLPDPEPDEPEPPMNIPSILPPEERTDDNSAYAFVLHPRTVHIVSPSSGQDGAASDPVRVAHLPSEGGTSSPAAPTEELDRGPGNPRTHEEVNAVEEEAVGLVQGLASRATAALSATLPTGGEVMPFKPVDRDLNQHERSGLFKLFGILFGGWLLGGLAEPRRPRKKRR